MTNSTTISIPPIFCPTCDAYVGRRPLCAGCGWERPANQLSTKTLAAVFAHEQPFLAAPLLIPATVQTDGRVLLICGYGRRGDGAGGLLALDADAGTLVWQADLGAAVPGGAALAPDGTTLLVGDDEGRLHALHVATGSPFWVAPLALDRGAIEAAPLPPANRNEPLFTVATASGILAQVDWRRGRVVHHFDLGAILGVTVRVAASPARRGSDVLVTALETRRGGGGALYVLDAAGRLDVRAATPSGLYTTPVLAPGGRTAIVGTNTGELLAIDLHSRQDTARHACCRKRRALRGQRGATVGGGRHGYGPGTLGIGMASQPQHTAGRGGRTARCCRQRR